MRSVNGRLSAPGHVAGAETAAGLASSAVESRGGASVEHLATLRQNCSDCCEIFDERIVQDSFKRHGFVMLRAGPDWVPRANPRMKITIKKRYIFRTERTEHPPGAGRREDTLLFVNDDVAGVSDAERGHAATEVGSRGQHVGERRAVVGECLNVVEDGSRNMEVKVAGENVRCRGDADRRNGGV